MALDGFVSAEQVSSLQSIAKVYLLKRKNDYENFCKELKFGFVGKDNDTVSDVTISLEARSTLHLDFNNIIN